ncbi:MAG TPA: Na+/H+ antiporter subunit C [Candidatus Limnocylindria bacterium]|nr:Na+/H+ antiporter subunit C [Candidatus Limnocylindria bacterium]
MELVMAVLVGGLFAAGIYTMLRRSIVRIAIGLVLLGHAANLLIFTAARLTRYEAPIIPADAQQIAEGVADPLPQALILTAIVISFGVLVFALTLIQRVFQVVGSDDVDELITTDRPEA